MHPRADARHITFADVEALADVLAPLRGRVEFNIEGDPRPDLLDLVRRIRPDQCTLVPVAPGEVTSQAGWPADTPRDAFRAVVDDLKAHGIRVSLFVDAETAAVDWAAEMGGDRVELYTEPFARAFAHGEAAAAASLHRFARCRPPRARPRPGRQRRPRPRPGQPRRCSARCRTWPRSPSATRSSAARCLSASRRTVREYLAVLQGDAA